MDTRGALGGACWKKEKRKKKEKRLRLDAHDVI
jgi:hypothetical protein